MKNKARGMYELIKEDKPPVYNSDFSKTIFNEWYKQLICDSEHELHNTELGKIYPESTIFENETIHDIQFTKVTFPNGITLLVRHHSITEK